MRNPITDRPDATESAFTIPKRFWQIETGETLRLFQPAPSTVWRYWITPILVRYGLTRNLELRMENEFNSYLDITNGYYSFPFRLSSNRVGMKLKIAEETGRFPEAALLFHIPLHWFVYSYHTALPTARLAFFHTLNDLMTLGYNIGMEWLEFDYGILSRTYPNYLYSVSAGIQISENLSTFVESYDSFNAFNGERYVINFNGGFTWLLRDNLQLDVAGSWGFDDYKYTDYFARNYFVSSGVSWRIPR